MTKKPLSGNQINCFIKNLEQVTCATGYHELLYHYLESKPQIYPAAREHIDSKMVDKLRELMDQAAPSMSTGDWILANGCTECGSTWVCEHDEKGKRE